MNENVKAEYEVPEVSVARFEASDILTSSIGGSGFPGDNVPLF